MACRETDILLVRVAELESVLERLGKEMARKDRFIVDQQNRIDDLEAWLEAQRRAGKRQAAPFSKGAPKPEPRTPGRKAGSAHGRHAQRSVPTGGPDRDFDALLPDCCPDCGGWRECCS